MKATLPALPSPSMFQKVCQALTFRLKFILKFLHHRKSIGLTSMYHKKKVVSSQKNVYFIKEYLCTNYGTFKLFMFYPYIILIKIALF